MKLGLFTNKKMVILRLSIAWLLSILCIQLIFYFITRNEAKNFSLSVKAIIQSELRVSNPQIASKMLMTLEQVGLIKCTKLTILDDNTIPFLDLTFKSECIEDNFSFQNVKVDAIYTAGNNVKWQVNFLKNNTDSLYYSLIALRILITFVFVFFIYFNFKEEKFRKVLYQAEIINEKNKNRVNEALAQTIQMIAHDVRKPFTMVKSLLNLIETTDHSDDIKSLSKTYLPEVNYAIMSVNSMVQDIMEIGSDQIKLFQEPVAVNSLILSSVNEIFRYDQNSDIQLQYQLDNNQQVYVDIMKSIRIFSNIISNAVQAMKNGGDIWFRSKDVKLNGTNMVEICIGNSNSFIEEDSLDDLFETFFTKNKKGGTGLGLAIAKKIVSIHGGTIYCRSNKSIGVEFYFTLPAANEIEKIGKLELPNHSRDLFLHNYKSVKNLSADSNFKDVLELESLLLEKIKILEEKIVQIIAVDDEAIYRDLIQELVPKSSPLRDKIIIQTYSKPNQAFDEITKSNCDLVLMDIDLNHHEKSGFDITKQLRDSGFENRICIHSNRGTFEYNEEFKRSGADFMIPKPLSYIHLLKLLDSVVSEKNNNSSQKHEIFKCKNTSADIGEDEYIVIIDDSFILRESWRIQIDVNQISFSTPEEFFLAIDANPSLLSNTTCIITDNDFGNQSIFTGHQLAEKLRNLNFSKPIFLCSDGIFEDQSIGKYFNKRVSKNALQCWQEIQLYLKII